MITMTTPKSTTPARNKVVGLMSDFSDGLVELKVGAAALSSPSAISCAAASLSSPSAISCAAALSSPSASSCASFQDRLAENQQCFGKGQLKVGITVDGNSLNVYVDEASGLKSQWRTKCSSYVQVQICPDDFSKSRLQTKVTMETNNPVYQQNLKFSLDNKDQKKRLMISVWHQDAVKNCSEFIGCLSFGLCHLVAKCNKQENGVSGWYYLLSAEIGHRKHILARPAEVVPMETMDESDKENKKKYQPITFELKHRQPGYGLTVRGPHPIRVGRVKVGGPAHQAGLLKGDIIQRINDESMSGRDMQQVAEIIRKSDVYCVIDVLRSVSKVNQCTKQINDCNSKQLSECTSKQVIDCTASFQLNFHEDVSSRSLYQTDLKQSSKLKRKSHDMDDSSVCKQPKTGDNNTEQNQNLFNEGLFCKPCGKAMFSRDSEHSGKQRNVSKSCEHVKYISNQLDRGHTNSLSTYKKWNPEMSAITTASSHIQSLVDSVISTDSSQSLLDNAINTDSSNICSSLINNTELTHYDSLNSLCTLEDTTYNSTSAPSSPTSSLATDSRLCDMTDFDTLSTLSGIECSMNSEEQIQRDLSVRTLIKCEEEFIKVMLRGIQMYSRPLRFCVLTAQQKEVLFQNVEKLVAMSQYNLSKLCDNKLMNEQTMNGSRPKYTAENIGDIYRQTVSLFCEAYTDYIQGLPAAMEILGKLRQYPEFEHVLHKQRSKCDLDILNFLQQPVVHFEFLRRGFQDILLNTNTDHNDLCHVEHVCQEIEDSACQMMF